jgi:hypothetical protein
MNHLGDNDIGRDGPYYIVQGAWNLTEINLSKDDSMF